MKGWRTEGRFKKGGQKLERAKTQRGTTAPLWQKQNYPWLKKKRNEGKVDGEEDRVKSGIKRSFGPFLSLASARYR